MSTHELYNLHEHEPMPEGEEAAPPMTRTMSTVRWLLLGAMTVFALVMILGAFGLAPWESAQGGPVQYHCPMHPTYISNQPGDCPICGMTLVPIAGSGTEIKPAADTTMKMASDSTQAKKAEPGQYTCPMDPEVISDTPGKCPICGMPLELVKPEPDTSGHDMGTMGDMGSAPVPGLVPVVIGPERLQLIGVKTGTVQRRNLSGSIKLTAYLTPDESKLSNLNIRVSGWVKKLYVDQTGQQVQAGEPLLSIYSQDLYQAQQDLLTGVAATKRAASDQMLTNVRDQLVAAARERLRLLGLTADEIAAIESSGKPQANLTLTSPFSGVVLEKSVVEGQFIGPDQNLFTIADLRTIWALADVYEQDISSARLGQTATMKMTGDRSEPLTGKVSFIYPTVSSATRTLKVRLAFDNPGLKLRPGMYADVTLNAGRDSALAVPSDAVMDGGETKYVFVVHDGTRFEPRLITTGRSSDDWIEVLSGVSQGETVVTSSNFLIDSESRLKAAVSGMGGTQAESHAGHSH